MKAIIQKTVTFNVSTEGLVKLLLLPVGFTLRRMEVGTNKLELEGVSSVTVVGQMVTEEDIAQPTRQEV